MNNQKGFANIIIISIIAVVVIVGGYFVISNMPPSFPPVRPISPEYMTQSELAEYKLTNGTPEEKEEVLTDFMAKLQKFRVATIPKEEQTDITSITPLIPSVIEAILDGTTLPRHEDTGWGNVYHFAATIMSKFAYKIDGIKREQDPKFGFWSSVGTADETARKSVHDSWLEWWNDNKQFITSNQPITPITSAEKNKIQILFPKSGDRLETGNTYEIRWENNSTQVPTTISLQSFTEGGQDLGYSNIATTNIPISGKITWKIPLTDTNLKYKLAIFGSQRQVIGKSEGFFTFKDEQPLIVGVENVVINPKYTFSFGTPFTITGATGIKLNNEPSPIIYSSAQTVQIGLVTARIVSFHADACEVLGYQDAPGCDVKGEQAVRIKFLAVVSSQGQHYVIQRDVYLTPTSKKTQKVGDTGYQYEFELRSMDIQKQQATIVIRKLQ